jgi:hypothetical protein
METEGLAGEKINLDPIFERFQRPYNGIAEASSTTFVKPRHDRKKL